MAKNAELVLYPFKIQNTENIIMFRTNEGFELRFSRDIFSKRVSSTKISNQRNYLELEINDDTVVCVNEYNVLDEFITPADFYIDNGEDAKSFYKEIHSHLVNDDLENHLSFSLELNKSIKEAGFPEFNTCLATTATHFENYDKYISRPSTTQSTPIFQIKINDSIPTSPSEKTIMHLASILNQEIFQAQDQFYKAIFKNTPIVRFKTIANSYEKQSELFKKNVSKHFIKCCIGLHAYFFTSGPWRKCWVALGYDPKTDSNNYKYQIIEIRTKRASFQVFERPEIEIEVNKNKDWYILKNFHPVNGFISKALKNFIIYILDDQGVLDVDSKFEELEDSDFKLFD